MKHYFFAFLMLTVFSAQAQVSITTNFKTCDRPAGPYQISISTEGVVILMDEKCSNLKLEKASYVRNLVTSNANAILVDLNINKKTNLYISEKVIECLKALHTVDAGYLMSSFHLERDSKEFAEEIANGTTEDNYYKQLGLEERVKRASKIERNGFRELMTRICGTAKVSIK